MEKSEEEKKAYLDEKKKKLQEIIDNDDPQMDEAHIYDITMQDGISDPRMSDGPYTLRRALTEREVAFLNETGTENLKVLENESHLGDSCTKIGDIIAEEELTDEEKQMLQAKKETVAKIKESMKTPSDNNRSGTVEYYFYNIGSVSLKCKEMQALLLGNKKLNFEPNMIGKIKEKIEAEKVQREEEKRERNAEKQKEVEKDKKSFSKGKELQNLVDKALESDDPSLDVPSYYDITIHEGGDPRMTAMDRNKRAILTPRQVMLANASKPYILDFKEYEDYNSDYCTNIGDKVDEKDLSQEEIDALSRKSEEIQKIKESKDYNKKGRVSSSEILDYDMDNRLEYSAKIKKGQFELLNMSKDHYEFEPNTISIDSIRKRIKEINMERGNR